MFEQTPQDNPEEKFELYPDEFMWADSLFDDVVRNHGNDQSFSWTDKKQAIKYHIERLKEGSAIDDGSKCYEWKISIKNESQGQPIVYIMDTPNFIHRNTDGTTQASYAPYTTDVIHSLGAEESNLLKNQPYIFGSDGELVPNPRYASPPNKSE